ncbi:RDD family protein [Chryseobacterium luquanense]|uniref:RDD family protein n=1 Tax=Chryseobacterium luquanense TaxID=2983766 RepID=A0ABT3Y749_9FLAO|nr:RDD family protein [Chryseobacterium luquanense]MCX8533980.1 RDD family protein [Chryseobacterium luquanense]
MEQKYFIHDGIGKKGPYTLEELRKLEIKRYTLIWHGALNNWTEADKLYELKSLFEATPPPINLRKEIQKVPPSLPQTTNVDYRTGRIEYLKDNTLQIHYENVIIQYRYANFGERLLARILDIFIIIIPAAIIPILPGWLYFSLMHCSESQQTIGQKALNIKLLSTDGAKINFGQSTGRFFGNILNALTFFIGFLMFFFNKRNQCLHDSLASTIVVSEIRRINKY